MPRIFISYRREEAADMSGRIADFLDRRFGAGTVFRDVNAILAGSNYVMALQRGLDEASVVLVLIGPHWIHLREPNGMRRIDSPNDFVRYEIATALRTGKLVIPILINGATLPTAAELPPDLIGLADRTPYVVRNDPYFADDMAGAIAAFRSAVAWAPASVGALSVTAAGILALMYFIASAASAPHFPHFAINDFLMFVAPRYTLVFAIIRSARTRRWLWFSLLLVAALAILSEIFISWDLALYVINLPILLILLAFSLFGPRQPYANPTKRRPTHRGVFTVFWVSLLAYAFAIAVAGALADGSKIEATAKIEAVIGLEVAWAIIIAGNALALPRAWQTRNWIWFSVLTVLLLPAIILFPLNAFTNLVDSWATPINGLIIAQLIAVGVFSWWGPRALPAYRRASHPAASVAAQQ
jgi:hypothetical protein